jgi:hypothetical protein
MALQKNRLAAGVLTRCRGQHEVFEDLRSVKCALDQALAPIARERQRTRSVTTPLRQCDTGGSQLDFSVDKLMALVSGR